MRQRFNPAREFGRTLVEQLAAARSAAAREDVARALHPDVRYWDCLRGEIAGREQVAAALCGPPIGGAEVTVEALAADGAHAVAEVRVTGSAHGGRFELRTTEAYAFDEQGVAWCRAYFDPVELPARP